MQFLADEPGKNWDLEWAALKAPVAQLFSRKRPRTLYQLWHRCYFEDLWQLIGERAGGDARFLEVGAGRGTTSMYLSSQGCDVTMVDLSSEGFRVAVRNFAHEDLKLPTMVVADARCSELPGGSFDCIYSIGLLEHFADPRPALSETLRLLKPGGLHFGVIIPNRPARIVWLVSLLFAPWRLPRLLLSANLRNLLRRMLGRKAGTGEPPVLRTDLDGEAYVSILREMGVSEAWSCPYNSYHSVFGDGWIERWIVLPLYQLHNAAKRTAGLRPAMRTIPSLASCHLLVFRK